MRGRSVDRLVRGLFAQAAATAVLTLILVCAGCRAFHFDAPEDIHAHGDALPNPLQVPLIDRDLMMDIVSEELDDYFRIYREERVRLVDHILTEGWIETHPQIGSTWMEPWRRDSLPGFERAHATLQTVRRFAKVRLIPARDTYLIDLAVFKELEDLPNPQNASVTSRPLRFDNSLDHDREELAIAAPNRGWIPLGRDMQLEQKLLKSIQARVHEACQAP